MEIIQVGPIIHSNWLIINYNMNSYLKQNQNQEIGLETLIT